MRYYIAVVHKEQKSAFGVRFPDVPGCYSAADRMDDLVPNAIEALDLFAEDSALPAPRGIGEIRKDKAVLADLAEGAFLVAVPLIDNENRVVRANITMERGMLRAIDKTAKERKLTRSAFLSQAARHEIERR
ncbi:MAG: type II toxin-antitoxin system HicB family antitoxin [Aestuariivirga sp.]